MGLASSQARLLMLTARKSDLEYRAQTISQRKINLAMQTEQLATEYTSALNNRKLELHFANAQDQAQYEDLSYAGITSSLQNFIGDYLVVTNSGKYVAADQQDAIKVLAKLYSSSTGGKWDELSADQKQSYAIANQSKIEIIDMVNNNDYFQDALRNGGLFLQKLNPEKNEYETVSFTSSAVIKDSLDTSDDAKAQADYEAKTLVLANQDKMLDLELQQIETQHSAIETEYDSVKKVIDKNIETSYKIFA